MTKYIQITLELGKSCVVTEEELCETLGGELANAGPGTRWIIEIIEMTDEEYAALPDQEGPLS
jgi:hypothetical protein